MVDNIKEPPGLRKKLEAVRRDIGKAEPVGARKVSELPKPKLRKVKPKLRKVNEELTDEVEFDKQTLTKDMGDIMDATQNLGKKAKKLRGVVDKKVQSPLKMAKKVLPGVRPGLGKLRVASGLSSKAEDRLVEKERFGIRTGEVGVNQFIGFEVPPVPEHRKLIIKPPAYFRQGGRRLG